MIFSEQSFSLMSHSSTSSRCTKESWRMADWCVDGKHTHTPIFLCANSFQGYSDFCRDLTSGSTWELDERNIHFGELLCRAGKGDKTLYRQQLSWRCWQTLSVSRQLLAKNEAGEWVWWWYLSALHLLVATCERAGKSCRLVSSLRDQKLPVCMSCW